MGGWSVRFDLWNFLIASIFSLLILTSSFKICFLILHGNSRKIIRQSTGATHAVVHEHYCALLPDKLAGGYVLWRQIGLLRLSAVVLFKTVRLRQTMKTKGSKNRWKEEFQQVELVLRFKSHRVLIIYSMWIWLYWSGLSGVCCSFSRSVNLRWDKLFRLFSSSDRMWNLWKSMWSSMWIDQPSSAFTCTAHLCLCLL